MRIRVKRLFLNKIYIYDKVFCLINKNRISFCFIRKQCVIIK